MLTEYSENLTIAHPKWPMRGASSRRLRKPSGQQGMRGLARGHQWARHLWPTTATTAMAEDDRVYSRDVEVQIHVARCEGAPAGE